ncbi:ABC transporter ATP-binding protein [Tropicimonas sp. IMCC34011]|uniref:ABC transporter ATP-binding protein n=1 Tax=Tropicimonas sp. IMCC34011 TaxID=2248759 RepID=UPI001E4D7D54|nr:ABC transporter ATP-binding protein [Tropicimonas sp. IMCC34011]
MNGTPDTPAKLRVHELEKRYGEVVALKPTNLEVESGEFLTLLGPSGSGKTTLLMMVAGLAAPSGGDIWIDGKLSTQLQPQKRDVGVVFQNYALFPHLTVRENIAFPLRMRRMSSSDIEQNVARLLKIVDLEDKGERLPTELSGGQQQRVALARCAVYGPSIILMDEPLGALDKKLRDTMQMEIKTMHKALGATILYVTHDQGEAMSMSDRVCVMRDGHIVQLGSPADLYHRPVSRFVGDFLGGATFLRANVAGEEGDEIVLKWQDTSIIKAKRPATSVATGDSVLCMMRPQNLRISSEPVPGANALPATVIASVMTGTMTEHFVRLADGTEVTAVELTTPGSQLLPDGANVHVSWLPENSVVFAGEQMT